MASFSELAGLGRHVHVHREFLARLQVLVAVDVVPAYEITDRHAKADVQTAGLPLF